MKIADELAEFLEGGLSILVGSVDAQGRPECTRGAGARVRGDRATIFLPVETSARTLENVRANPRVAVTFSRPHDHRTYQLKGRVTAITDATSDDALVQERWHAGFVEQLAVVGVARAVSRRIRLRPSVAVELVVDELFQQTPGPNAGRRLQ